MKAFYNDVDVKACAWLEELVAAGAVSSGDVVLRSISDVGADDLRGYGRAHFFAGIGGWERALAKGGWPADRPVWTGSCPCQPFSCAGKGKGTEDERHLWPEFFRLIAECRPSVVFGEQVASAAGRDWLDGVRGDLEGLGYAVGAADLCAPCAGEVGEGWVLRGGFSGGTVSREPMRVGPPHIRQRLYWVAWLRNGQWTVDNGQRGGVGAARDGNYPPCPPASGGSSACVGFQHVHGEGRGAGVVGSASAGYGGSVESAGGDGGSGVSDAECGPAERQRFDVGAASGGAEGEAWERERLRNDVGAGDDVGGATDAECSERGSNAFADEQYGSVAGRDEASGGAGACGEDGGVADGPVHGGAEYGLEPGQWGLPPAGDGAECGGDHGTLRASDAEDAHGRGLFGPGEGVGSVGERAPGEFERCGGFGGDGDASGVEQWRDTLSGAHGERESLGRSDGVGSGILPVPRGRILHTGHEGLEGFGGDVDGGGEPGWVGEVAAGSVAAAGGHGGWSEYDILPFRDGKARRVERGTFPLAYGLPAGVVPSGDPSVEEVRNSQEARVMRLKGYGNAIVDEVAAIFVAAFLESEKELTVDS